MILYDYFVYPIYKDFFNTLHSRWIIKTDNRLNWAQIFTSP